MTSASRRYARWFAVGTFLCVLTPACYTLFDHPRLAQLDYERPSDNRCTKCHVPEQLWALLHPERRATRTESWRDYYDYPWWFDGRVGPSDTTRAGQVREVEDASAR
jgi:hypothetical protein